MNGTEESERLLETIGKKPHDHYSRVQWNECRCRSHVLRAKQRTLVKVLDWMNETERLIEENCC